MGEAGVLELDLPLPPSPNDADLSAFAHPMQQTRAKNEYKRSVWYAAQGQHAALANPPGKVLVTARFRVHNLRDEDNLHGSLKYVLDALRQPDPGEDVSWRHGIATSKGYFVDDAPPHLVLADVTQRIDRSDKGLTLRIAEVAGQPNLTEAAG